MAAEFSSGKTITLQEFIRGEQLRHSASTGELTNILLTIALGTKIVSRGVNSAGLASLLGLTGETNVQGEEVQKLDEYADRVFSSILGRSGHFISMVSEERESIFPAKAGSAHSQYVIAFDPLDGSSNIDVNVAIGTIWGIYRRRSDGARVDPKDTQDFFQAGHTQVAAGYAIYGSSTMLVFSTGQGVNGFTLDPTIGEFILTHPNMLIPSDGIIYSCNEANATHWSAGVKHYIDSLRRQEGIYQESAHSGKGAASERQFKLRYVGSLVADFHRTMLKGGIFLYPADRKNLNGKLRLLYECAPLAFIVEQARGKASNGKGPILEMIPESIHQRTPLFIGSPHMVEAVERAVAEFG